LHMLELIMNHIDGDWGDLIYALAEEDSNFLHKELRYQTLALFD
jgi:hypothetical protein